MDTTLDEYRLSHELLGHSADVRSVAVGAEDTVYSGSRDKTMKMWKRNGNAYTEGVTYQDHSNFVSCVCYLPNEQWICSGSNDATVCIYKEGSYVPILVLKGHESTVCSIAAGVEAQSLITGSWDKTARVWRIDEMGGVTHTVLQGHEAAVWAVASLPDEKKFITGGADKCIYYWNVKGEKLRLLKGHTDCVRGLLALPHNAFASCANDATIRYWNDDGECVQELTGHTNYIYSIAHNKALGGDCIVSCGEDSTLRMWNVANGKELGAPILHPAQSIWSVACLPNGDIVTGSSDGIVRIFTRDKTRVAAKDTLDAFNLAVSAWSQQINQELGGIKKTDLPGPESLLIDGNQEGQTKMVRHADGNIKLYSWEQGKWNLVGDVTGAAGGSQETSGKTLFEGKEYDYVFSVDISDTSPPIKLPYNRGEDPWHAAQAFIHRNFLPQAYLDQVANFIIKNVKDAAPVLTQSSSRGYQDPFTGGSRYVPGSSNSDLTAGGNVDPFTGGASYSTAVSQQQTQKLATYNNSSNSEAERHFPISKYSTFDNCDMQKVLSKLREFNEKHADNSHKVSNTLLDAVMKLAEPTQQANTTAIEALRHLLNWPSDVLFPVLDVTRLAIRDETIFSTLNAMNFIDCILPHMTTSAPNQLMLLRCLANMMVHPAGRKEIDARLPALVGQINAIKSGSANLQIAIATFFLNITISQTISVANGEQCACATEGLLELMKWANDLEACYRCMQAIGNLTTTPFGQQTIAEVLAVSNVMDKIKELTHTPHAAGFAKLNSVGTALLSSI